MNAQVNIKIAITALLSLVFQIVIAQNSANSEMPLDVKSSEAAVMLSWTQEAGQQDVYIVERSLDGQHWEQVNTLRFPAVAEMPRICEYADENVRKGNTYYYRLSVFEASGEFYVTAPESIFVGDKTFASR